MKRWGCLSQFITLLFGVLVVINLVGMVSVKAEEKKRYVVLIVDTSSDSLFYDEKMENILFRAFSPIQEVKNAALEFINRIPDNGSTEVAIITFGETTRTLTSFTNSYSWLEGYISNLENNLVGGRRNLGLALKTADKMLNKLESSAEKTVILVSSGMTDEGEHSETGHWSSDSEGSNWRNSESKIHFYEYANSAYEYAESIKNKDAKIYTIGMVKMMDNCPEEVQPAAALFQSVLSDMASENCYFPVTDIKEFERIFAEMMNQVVQGRCGTFEFAATDERFDYKSTYYYEDGYFDIPAEHYNESLATMSLCFALSAFGGNGTSMEPAYYTPDQAVFVQLPFFFDSFYLWPNMVKTKEKVYKNQWSNAENLLLEIGFDCIDKSDDFKEEPKTDSIGVIVGLKTIESKEGEYTLIALATRGGNYYSEWAGNFNIGEEGNHLGFEKAKDKAKDFLDKYIGDHFDDIKGTVKLWMAGYSRGGAVVNLLAGDITTEKVIGEGDKVVSLAPQNIYAYCFEPPRGLNTKVCPQRVAGSYTNIHNIVNQNDIVPLVAMEGWDFIRYGVSEYVIPYTDYSPDYVGKVANMMTYYERIETDAVRESYVSLKEYDSQYESVIEKAKQDIERDYNSFCSKKTKDNISDEEFYYENINSTYPLFETVWPDILMALESGEKLKYIKDYSVLFKYYDGYGIFENLYDYINGLKHLKKFVNTSDYQSITDKVSRIDLFSKYMLPDTMFSVRGIIGIVAKDYIAEYGIENMGDVNEAVVNMIANGFSSRDIYDSEVQNGLMLLIELVKRKTNPIELNGKDVLKAALGGSLGDWLSLFWPIFKFKAFDSADSIVDIVYDNIVAYCKKNRINLDEYISSYERITFKNGIKKLIKAVVNSVNSQKGTDDLYSLICNFDLIKMAHYPELCLAWLQSQDPNYGENNKKIYVPSMKRLLRINCPVDIEVYDRYGKLVAKIVNNIPQVIPGSCILSSYTSDGEKLICLPFGEEYHVDIRATEDGKMDVSMNIIGVEGDYKYIENYYEIELLNGNTYSIVVSDGIDLDDEGNITEIIKGVYIKSQEKTIMPSVVLEGESANSAIYSIITDVTTNYGGVIIGGGEYIEGSYATVRAAEYEDCSFVGWYEGDELVSTEREYRFRVMGDRSLTARFDGETQYGNNGIFTAELTASEGGFIYGEKEITALDGYPFEICAVPYDGYEFVGWETDENCIIENSEEWTTKLTLVDTDVMVTAQFKKIESNENNQENLDDNPNDNNNDQDENENQHSDVISGSEYRIVSDGIDIIYETETAWNGGYNGKITINNNTGKDLSEWRLSFELPSTITNIWNAQFIENGEKKYAIKDVGWNSVIPVGTSVSIGFTAMGDIVKEPDGFIFEEKAHNSGNDGCTIEFVKTNEWDGGCTGEIVITNISDKTIKDWSLEFDCSGKVNGFWNGTLISNEGDRYIIGNAGYNYSIGPGTSARIGINLSVNNNSELPTSFRINGK